MTRSNLRHLLNRHFSLGELHQLAFDLGVDNENLPGDTREAKAQSQ